MDSVAFIFALVLFGLGLYILIDDIRFRRKARHALATVLSAERVVSTVNDTDARGRHKKRKRVTWKTRYRFRIDGQDYVNEGELDDEPTEAISIWYESGNPQKSRTFRSRAGLGWTLL